MVMYHLASEGTKLLPESSQYVIYVLHRHLKRAHARNNL